MADRIRLRRDTAANWTTANPILKVAEAGWETDTGKLKLGDDVKTWTQLSYAARSFVWRGVYANGTAYKSMDCVSYLGASYVCIADSTGNAVTNAAYWNLLSAKGDNGTDGIDGTDGTTFTWRGPYSNTATYLVGQAVSYLGTAYMCISPTTAGQAPTNAVKWDTLAEKGAAGGNGSNGTSLNWRGAWTTGIVYAPFDAVTKDGTSYICILASTSNTPPNATYWGILAAKGTDGLNGGVNGTNGTNGTDGTSFTWKGAYASGTAYVSGDAVSYGNSSYMCKANSSGNIPTNTSFWDLLALKGTDGTSGSAGSPGSNGTSFIWRGAYSAITAYAVNDVVSFSGSSYICISSTTGNDPTSTVKWSVVALKGDTGPSGGSGGTGFTATVSTYWTSTAGQVMFETISGYTDANEDNYLVSVGAQDQIPNVHYTITSGVGNAGRLTLGSAPPAGTLVVVRALIAGTSGGGTGSSIYDPVFINGTLSTAIGGASSQDAQVWRTKTLSQVFDQILFPTLLPTYTIPTISLSGSLSGYYEIGSTQTQSLSLVGTKNDAGAFSSLTVKRDGSSIQSTSSPTVSSAAPIEDQFGYTNPNNPNRAYTLSYQDAFTVTSGSIGWGGSSVYSIGSAKKNNRNTNDSRTFSERITEAPQDGSSSLTPSPISITGGYPYFWGVSSTSLLSNDVDSLVYTGDASVNKVVADASGSISIAFNASAKFLWFAHVSSIPTKTNWFNNSINKGGIGVGQFFNFTTSQNFTSASGYWVEVPFTVYISSIITDTAGDFILS